MDYYFTIKFFEMFLRELAFVDCFGRKTDLTDQEIDRLAGLEKLAKASGLVHFQRGMDYLSFGKRDWAVSEVRGHIEKACRVMGDMVLVRHKTHFGIK